MVSKPSEVGFFDDTPMQRSTLTWKDFTNRKQNQSGRDFKEIKTICERNFNKFVDLTPYMIERPHVVESTD